MSTDKYKKHFLMNTESVVEYVKDMLDYFPKDANLKASEIGDGNINYVFKIWDEDSKKSLVIKQADQLLRSSGRPLDLHRNRIEAEILKIQSKLAPGFVPKIYDYNEDMFALAMEDISEYKNLRKELAAGKIFPDFAKDITRFMVDTLVSTTDLVMERHEKKEKVKLFVNVDLCDISEDLVFTEPYYNYKNRNIITSGMEDFVEQNLYRDEHLKAEVGYLRNQFMNNAQALIHGDLHSGSIFINEKGIKVIDPEFAFYGPMGYDVGNVIGNLYFALTNKICLEPTAEKNIHWLEDSIVKIYDGFKVELSKKMDELVDFPLYNKEFQEKYMESVLADSIGYAGTEMIRRTVGDAKVSEVTSVRDISQRIRLEKILIAFGANIIKNRNQIKTGADLLAEYKKVVDLI